MRIDVLTLFPHMITDYCSQSIVGIAQKNRVIEINAHNPRDYSADKHNKVDDTPYGGGPGMVLSPQPFFDCFNDLATNNPNLKAIDLKDLDKGTINHPEKRNYEVILTCPSGKTFNQELARDLSKKDNLVFLCGRYEGFDERIRKLATMELSLGDFVISGGELAALTILDSSVRLIDGVLGDDNSSVAESFEIGSYLDQLSKREVNDLLEKTGLKSREDLENIQLLEYPQYTRPKDFRGELVPDVLDSGNHKQILLWRLEQAIKRTQAKRPDLL